MNFAIEGREMEIGGTYYDSDDGVYSVYWGPSVYGVPLKTANQWKAVHLPSKRILSYHKFRHTAEASCEKHARRVAKQAARLNKKRRK